MSKTLEQIVAELDAPIPRDVVSQREGSGGRSLSYLEGWYVIDRLNKVFGPLGWSKEILDVKEVVNTTRKGTFPAYIVKVRLTFVWEVNGKFESSFRDAYGYGADKSDQNAHELAIKEAVTDALKVAAKDLGMSMGLALYDKTQEYVTDEPSQTPAPVQATLRSVPTPQAAAATGANKDLLLKAISETARVLVGKKLKTNPEIRELMKNRFGVEDKAQLEAAQAQEFLNELKGMIA